MIVCLLEKSIIDKWEIDKIGLDRYHRRRLYQLKFEKMSPKNIFKAIFKLIDLLLYVSDIYSDIAFTILLYNNCHYNYFQGSLLIFAISYITTVIHLKYFVNCRTNWTKATKAIFYPFFTILVILDKFDSMISSKLNNYLS